jgi:hypothetical protein
VVDARSWKEERRGEGRKGRGFENGWEIRPNEPKLGVWDDACYYIEEKTSGRDLAEGSGRDHVLGMTR